ncbi:hypothetical protein K431DRAFT_314963 [Polychaeton citri CBS 116435]|uniref:Uncharacterized protein n=1 Tax=Polychaeton citri CBS 116435 TaxID=1314669 RepID=A0A9P4Q2Z0_9PEZI|nr:hypothetical protein K431DRAFT_314963 [Polychaeton citri CBS 116435]
MARLMTAAVTPKITHEGRTKDEAAAAKARSTGGTPGDELVPRDSDAGEQRSNDEHDTVAVATNIPDSAVRTNIDNQHLHQQTHTATLPLAPSPSAFLHEMPSSNTRSTGRLKRLSNYVKKPPRQVNPAPPQHPSSRSKLANDSTRYREDVWIPPVTPESKDSMIRRAMSDYDRFSPTKKQRRELKRRHKTQQLDAERTASQKDAAQADIQLRQEQNVVLVPQVDTSHALKETFVSPQTSRRRKREELQRAAMTGNVEENHDDGQAIATVVIDSIAPRRTSGLSVEVGGRPRTGGRGSSGKSALLTSSTVSRKDGGVADTSTLETATVQPARRAPSPKVTRFVTTPPQRMRRIGRPPKEPFSDFSIEKPIREGQGRDKLSRRGTRTQTEATVTRQSPRIAAKNAGTTTERREQQPKPARIDPETLQFAERQDGEAQASDESEDENSELKDEYDEYWHRYPLLLKLKRSLGHALGGVLEFEKTSGLTLTPVVERTIAIVELCSKLKLQLSRLRNGIEDDNDPANNLVELDAKLYAVKGTKNMAVTDSNIELSCEIYAIVVPCLVKLLCHQRNCYIQIDQEKRKDARRPLSIGHVDTLLKVVDMVFRFVDVAHYYPRSKAKSTQDGASANESPIKYREYCVRKVRPNLRASMAILKDMMDEFAEDTRHANGLREFEQTQRIKTVQQEEKRRLDAIESVRNRWRHLHEERRAAEGGFLAIWVRGRQAAYDSLRDPDYWLHELDSNGEPFERLQIFSPRSGPPPQMVMEARSKYWSTEQVQALGVALKRFAEECGPGDPDMLLVKIFRSCCYQRGPLVEFNVTDIVTKAADLKAFFIEKGYQGDWIEAIPEWVKPLSIEGIENGQ